MIYKAAENRYEVMEYKRCGRSGVLLPRISLGLWQNFGLEKPLDEQKEILFRAFDLGKQLRTSGQWDGRGEFRRCPQIRPGPVQG